MQIVINFSCLFNYLIVALSFFINFLPIVSSQFLQFGALPNNIGVQPNFDQSNFFGRSLFPEVHFRAFEPRGFQIIIEKRKDILELVKFSYQINNGLLRTPPLQDSPSSWIHFNPKEKLKINDYVNYTIDVISNRFDPNRAFAGNGFYKIGFNFGAQRYSYTNNEIVNITGLESLCESNLLQPSEKMNCEEERPIFEDDFSTGVLNKNLWTVEHYIPLYSEENYEFVSYQDNPNSIFISNSNLHLKPILVPNSQLVGTLDLRQKCTRTLQQACFYTQVGANYLPPITSGKIVSNFSFKYGKIEVKAKLPSGDWIFPQIELIPDDLTKKYPKILIGYSRGNKNLLTKEGKEIGSSILFGGYLNSSEEMRDDSVLKYINLGDNLRDKMNVFSLTWTPDKITLAVNNDIYSTSYQKINEGSYRISLGVGVGGNFDFPDDSKSGNFVKPWKNDAIKQVKQFLDHKNDWISSWVGDKIGLQIEYVKVFAV